MNDAAAWGAFRTAIGEQIPSETFEALENLKLENVEKFASTHTTEGLLLAALCGEAEPEDEVVEALIAAWREEKGEAEKRATDDAHIADLKSQLEHLKGENEQLSFASRMVDEQVAALKREVEVLRDEKEDAATQARKAEERAAARTLSMSSRANVRLIPLPLSAWRRCTMSWGR
jgi:predicted RNase H-like nuclease (RuvC/YqgF family)